jgi:hypothetical protein
MLRGRCGPWQTQGCSEVPDPTKQRALPHQENTDLSASGAGRCFITVAEPFHAQRVGNSGVELSRITLHVSIVPNGYGIHLFCAKTRLGHDRIDETQT